MDGQCVCSGYKVRILAALEEPRTAAGVVAELAQKAGCTVSEVATASIYKCLTQLVDSGHVVKTAYKRRVGYTFIRVGV
jgi:hypothetical protein